MTNSNTYSVVPTAKQVRVISEPVSISKAYDSRNEDFSYQLVLGNGIKLLFSSCKIQGLTYNKMVRMGFTQPKRSFLSEQEEAHWQGVSADKADKSKHGHTVITSITTSGTGSHLVWDFYKQKTVPKAELTTV